MYNITYNNSFAYVWGLRLQIVDDPYIWVNAGNNSSLFLCLLIIEARKTHERGNSAHHDVRSNLVVLLALISGCELCRLERAGCGIWPIVIIRPILTVPFATNISVNIFSVYIFKIRYMTGLLHEGKFHVGDLLKPAIFDSLPWAYVMCNWAQILLHRRHWPRE